MRYDLLCIGDVFCDIIAKPVKRLPKANQQTITGIVVNKGGEAANTACAASMLGLKTAFIGRAGKDMLSMKIIERIKECGVDVFCKRDDKEIAITMALAWGRDDRAFISSQGANKGLSMKDIDEKVLERSRHVMRGGIWHTSKLLDVNWRILKKAKGTGKRTSMNLAWDPMGWKRERKEKIFECMRYTDLVFLNKEELKALCGRKKEKALLEKGAGVIGVHQGAKGSRVVAEGVELEVPGLKVERMNSTGAGDVYNAAFIYGDRKEWDLEETARFANTAAAMHVEREGDFLPKAREVRRRARKG